MYQHPTADKVYLSGPFDPEGLLGSIEIYVNVSACNILS